MKTLFPSSLLTAALVAGLVSFGDTHASTTAENRGASRVMIIFQEPENFTDVKLSHMGPTAKGYLEELGKFLEQEIERYLKPGERMEVLFTDIDMAGDFEPWLGPNLQDVRVIKGIYPPRFAFLYRILGADGEVVDDGEVKLTDLLYQNRIGIQKDQPLFYEKEILRDWVRRTLK
jgi:hypothetical protein